MEMGNLFFRFDGGREAGRIQELLAQGGPVVLACTLNACVFLTDRARFCKRFVFFRTLRMDVPST